MDRFDETVQKAKDVFDVAVKKTGEFVNAGKQKIAVANLENKLTKAYAELGKLQFKALKDTEINDPDVVAAVFEIKQIISEIKQLLNEIEKTEGKLTCSFCRSKNPDNSAFCNKCGKPLVKND